MKLRAGDKQWRELVDRLLDSAEDRPGGYKKLFFMEKMGFQDQTVNKNQCLYLFWISHDYRRTISLTILICGGGSSAQIFTSNLMEHQILTRCILCKNIWNLFLQLKTNIDQVSNFIYQVPRTKGLEVSSIQLQDKRRPSCTSSCGSCTRVELLAVHADLWALHQWYKHSSSQEEGSAASSCKFLLNHHNNSKKIQPALI